MKALVTGASGFVGKHLVSHLLASGYSVVATGHHDASPFDDDVSYIKVDLMDPNEADKLPLGGIDVVFHLAGLAAVGPSFKEPLQYVETNSGIQINLFEAALHQKATPRFIVISSGTLYDVRASLPLTELSPTLPSSPYAVSKLGQELLGQYYSTRGLEVIIARPFNHIGPGQAAGFLVPDLIQKIQHAAKTGDLKISVGNLDTKRDYTDVRNIAKAYLLLAEKGRPGEIYNICSGKSISGREILAHLMRLMDCQVEVEVDPELIRPSDVGEVYGSYTKLHGDTGWDPQIDLEETLRDTLDNWREQS